MGKKGKKTQAGKPKKLTPKDIGKRLNVLAKKVEEELEGADLFAPLPPTEDCAICLVPMSCIKSETFYQACCGKTICLACFIEHKESVNKQNEEKSAGKKVAFTCPFCREPVPLTTDSMETVDAEYARLQARCLRSDRNALGMMGKHYREGEHIAKDHLKALDCWIRAVELGSAEACACIGDSYIQGDGLAADKERVVLFQRVGALRGAVLARHNIGYSEYYNLGNHEIAIRHWKIAAEAGLQDSLNALRRIYNGNKAGKEFINKEYLESTYRACHEAQMEVKTEEREKHSGAD